jgi:hypothetical protein
MPELCAGNKTMQLTFAQITCVVIWRETMAFMRSGAVCLFSGAILLTITDTMEVIDRTDFNQCVAALAVMSYAIADAPEKLPR